MIFPVQDADHTVRFFTGRRGRESTRPAIAPFDPEGDRFPIGKSTSRSRWANRAASDVKKPHAGDGAIAALATRNSSQKSSGIRVGTPKKGRLTQSDDRNPFRRGRYADTFRLRGVGSGEQIHLRLQSKSFDTYLQVVNRRTGELLFSNDDMGYGSLNSRLTFMAEPGVKYDLKVSSYARKETGKYTLRVKSFTPKDRGFDFNAGYGLINAADAVATAAQRDPFADAPPLPDSKQWHLDQIDAPDVWAEGITGDGVVVAVLDSGVDYRHPDLKDNIWRNPGEIAGNGIDDDGNGYVDDVRGWDMIDGDRTPRDLNGHGTYVSGLIAGKQNDFGVTGVAPDAQIMPVRVLDRFGSGGWKEVAKGIRYAVENGADIINMSLGTLPGAKVPRRMRRALKFAQRNGVFVAIAAGNERQSFGITRPGEPAFWASTRDLAIAVGATDEDLTIADFSNPTGNNPNSRFVSAPGDMTYSIVPWENELSFAASGTSFATPHVAGVAALMLSANPDLTPVEIMDILMQTASTENLTVV